MKRSNMETIIMKYWMIEAKIHNIQNKLLEYFDAEFSESFMDGVIDLLDKKVKELSEKIKEKK